MLTATKLVGGVFLSLTALYASYLFLSLQSTFTLTSTVYYINGLLGFWIGWRSIGFDPGMGGKWSIITGLRGALIFAVISAMAFGFWTVYVKLENFFIRDFDDILESWYKAFVEYFGLITAPDVLLALVIGGCVSGLGAGLANRYLS